MSAYPSYPILLDSDREPEPGWEDSLAASGTQHSRQLHSQQYYRFRVLHNLTLAQFNALEADYAGGPRTVRTLTWFTESPAVTYTVKYQAPPEIITNHGNDRYTVRVLLRGYKD